MVEEILQHILKDIILFLKDNHEVSKNKINTVFPKPIAEYLLSVDAELLLADIKVLVNLIVKGEHTESGLVKAIIKYFAVDLVSLIDKFYSGKSINNMYLSSQLEKYLENYTEQELISEIHRFIKKYNDIPLIIVQVPADLENKSEIREYFQDKYENSVVEFQQNKDLLGGIKIFVDGKVTDLTWVSKVKSLELINI